MKMSSEKERVWREDGLRRTTIARSYGRFGNSVRPYRDEGADEYENQYGAFRAPDKEIAAADCVGLVTVLGLMVSGAILLAVWADSHSTF
jgi:hypothetical protein